MKELTYREKLDIYETLKDIWRSSDTITYKELEKVQIKEWGQVAWKWSTLRNRASKEGWNKEKGINISKIIRDKKREILEKDEIVEGEILEERGEEYQQILRGLEKKYRGDFEEVRSQILDAVRQEDIKKLKLLKMALETIEGARTLDLRLSGVLDVHEYRKLEVEILKLELLTLEKTEKIIGSDQL